MSYARGCCVFLNIFPLHHKGLHSTGTSTVLLIIKLMCFVVDQKFSQVSHVTHIILHILLYIHSNVSVICILVITHVISHSVGDHQGLPSVHAKLTNTISDASHHLECAIGLMVTSIKMSIFFLVTTASPMCT